MWICMWLPCKVCMGNTILTAKPADSDTHRCPMVFSRSRWHQYKVIQPYVWSSICQSFFRAWFCCQGCRFHWKLGEIEHIWGSLEVYGLGFIWQVRISFVRVQFLPEIFLWGVFTTIAPLTTSKHVDLHVICMGNTILTAKPADFDTHRCPMVFSRSRWHQYKVIQP